MPEEYQSGDQFSSLTLIRVLPDTTGNAQTDKNINNCIGYVFVIESEEKFPNPFWKLPGGHGKKDELGETVEEPRACARREVLGEAGLDIPDENFRYVDAIKLYRPVPHWLFLYLAWVRESDVSWMGRPHDENEDERPEYFTVDEFYELIRGGKFFPRHYDLLVKNVLILPFGRDQRAAS